MTPASRRIFVSYRRNDAAAHAGWLATELRSQRAGDVFLDVDTISLGENFVRRIEREIERCDVVMVLIGRDWLETSDGGDEPRLFDELDWVHLEVKAALERDIPVIPVLVEGARMPSPAQLPVTLRELAYRAGIALREASWSIDVAQLISALPSTAPPLPPGPTPPPRKQPASRLGQDTVIVAARSAYPEYLEASAYVCQGGRTFRPVSRLGFYTGREIKREVPLVLHIRDDVPWTPQHADELRRRGSEYDAEVAALIELDANPSSGWFAKRPATIRFKVICLSPPNDPRTIRLEHPVHHDGPSAWTMGQRYLDSAVLSTSPRTTAEL